MSGKKRPALLRAIIDEMNVMDRMVRPPFGKAKRDCIRLLCNEELERHAWNEEDSITTLNVMQSQYSHIRQSDAEWGAIEAAKEAIAQVAVLRAEIAKRDETIELLKKAMRKTDFAYYFGPDYVDEDTGE